MFYELLYMDTPVLVSQQNVDTGCHLEDLPKTIANRFVSFCCLMAYQPFGLFIAKSILPEE